MTTIFCSNGFFRHIPVNESVSYFLQNGIKNIEISSGINDEESLAYLKNLQKDDVRFRLHNYFPNLNHNFVLNLSSADVLVRSLSKDLIRTAVQWSSELESDYYAFHAGFRLSPTPSELGGNLTAKDMISFQDSKDIFINEVIELAEYARGYGVHLAVENNVYDSNNYSRFKPQNPFLLCGDIESDILDHLPSDVGILLDVAHLKVSAATLNFNKTEAVDRWLNKISGLHLSDNDSKRDTNNGFNEDAWFLKLLEHEVKAMTIEVYDQDPEQLLEYIALVEDNLISH